MKTNEISVKTLDRIMVKYEDLKNLSKVVSEFDSKDHVDNICGQFKKILITIEDKDYAKFNAMFQIIVDGKRPLKMRGVIIESHENVGGKTRIEMTTGYYYEDKFIVDEKMDMDVSGIGFSVLTYLYIMSENRETKTVYNETFVSDKVVQEKIVTYKKNKSKQMKRKVKINNKRIIVINTMNEGDKRAYERVVESWNVRGHWREYKNGNRVWIKGYKKGEGKSDGKEYTI